MKECNPNDIGLMREKVNTMTDSEKYSWPMSGDHLVNICFLNTNNQEENGDLILCISIQNLLNFTHGWSIQNTMMVCFVSHVWYLEAVSVVQN